MSGKRDLNGLEQAAISVIGRAVAFDNEGRYVTALASYQEGKFS